jgi:DNA-binding NtrC family response regulator
MLSDSTIGPLEEGKQSIQRRRLLVVGEDLGDLTSCRAFLEKVGYQAIACSSHEQSARSLQSGVFNFILLHQGSPGFDWRGVLEQAMAIDRSTPVLVVTRSIDMPSNLDAMQLGASDYVEEPVTGSELVRLIEAYLPTQARASQPSGGAGLTLAPQPYLTHLYFASPGEQRNFGCLLHDRDKAECVQ